MGPVDNHTHTHTQARTHEICNTSSRDQHVNKLEYAMRYALIGFGFFKFRGGRRRRVRHHHRVRRRRLAAAASSLRSTWRSSSGSHRRRRRDHLRRRRRWWQRRRAGRSLRRVVVRNRSLRRRRRSPSRYRMTDCCCCYYCSYRVGCCGIYSAAMGTKKNNRKMSGRCFLFRGIRKVRGGIYRCFDFLIDCLTGAGDCVAVACE